MNPVIDELTVWNNRDGVLLNYTARLSVRNARIVGIGARTNLTDATANSGVGLDLGTGITDGPGRLQNVTIEGFDHGLIAPRNGQWELSRLTLRNLRDIYIKETRLGPRTLLMEQVEFGALEGTAVSGRERRRVNVVLDPDLEPFGGLQPFFFLLPDYLSINGTGVYFDQRDADFVPLPSEDYDIEDELEAYADLSNAELMDAFGLSFGGSPTPAGSWRDETLEGGSWGAYPRIVTLQPTLSDMTSGGEFPEPPEGDRDPVISGNALALERGETVVLLPSNINTLDTDSLPSELLYAANDVRNGHFARFEDPGAPITTFTHAEVEAGVLRFVHDGSASAPSYRLAVTDGVFTSPTTEAAVSFDAGDVPAATGAVVFSDGFERSFGR